MGNGRVKVAANCIGDLSNIFAAGLIPLIGPDGHLQNLALAVRIGLLSEKCFAACFALPRISFGSLRSAISPPLQNKMAGTSAGWRGNRELTYHSKPNVWFDEQAELNGYLKGKSARD